MYGHIISIVIGAYYILEFIIVKINSKLMGMTGKYAYDLWMVKDQIPEFISCSTMALFRPWKSSFYLIIDIRCLVPVRTATSIINIVSVKIEGNMHTQHNRQSLFQFGFKELKLFI